ncbi:hypothetical protein [Paenibacillus thalictri]|uniref:hypothetical protein n=1 Tax=Paenibacillus thalictri TaxID=2527873 RepID=UPI0010354BE7|nr:hypothetical protein [Paenibacillus thalictri]
MYRNPFFQLLTATIMQLPVAYNWTFFVGADFAIAHFSRDGLHFFTAGKCRCDGLLRENDWMCANIFAAYLELSLSAKSFIRTPSL